MLIPQALQILEGTNERIQLLGYQLLSLDDSPSQPAKRELLNDLVMRYTMLLQHIVLNDDGDEILDTIGENDADLNAILADLQTLAKTNQIPGLPIPRTTYVISGSGDVAYPISLVNGGTGASLGDPGADQIMFWDDSASSVTWLTVGTGLSITGTTISASLSNGNGTTANGNSVNLGGTVSSNTSFLDSDSTHTINFGGLVNPFAGFDVTVTGSSAGHVRFTSDGGQFILGENGLYIFGAYVHIEGIPNGSGLTYNNTTYSFDLGGTISASGSAVLTDGRATKVGVQYDAATAVGTNFTDTTIINRSYGDGRYIQGTVGVADNIVLRSDGTGGRTLQAAPFTIDDFGNFISGDSTIAGTARTWTATGSPASVGLTISTKSAGVFTVSSPEQYFQGTVAGVNYDFSVSNSPVFQGNQQQSLSVKGGRSLTTAIAGGDLTLTGGDAFVGNANGGNLILRRGVGFGSGVAGQIMMSDIPSSDPGIPGAVYRTAGALMVSL